MLNFTPEESDLLDTAFQVFLKLLLIKDSDREIVENIFLSVFCNRVSFRSVSGLCLIMSSFSNFESFNFFFIRLLFRDINRLRLYLVFIPKFVLVILDLSLFFNRTGFTSSSVSSFFYWLINNVCLSSLFLYCFVIRNFLCVSMIFCFCNRLRFSNCSPVRFISCIHPSLIILGDQAFLCFFIWLLNSLLHFLLLFIFEVMWLILLTQKANFFL